jgi:hypothetical protein
MLTVISPSESEELEELVSESELSLDEVSEEESEFEFESTVARLTLPFLDFLLFFFFFQGQFCELCPDFPYLEHLRPEDDFLTAHLTTAFITLFNVKSAILSVTSSIGS